MTRYVPRPYQPAITNHIIDNPRCNVFAGMGVGKTPATLEAISTLLLLGEVQRVLIVAPKRVAVSTWPGEIANFKGSFGHLTMAVAVGSDKERRAAIESSARIVTINFDNLTWLVENYGATWPFDMVVADEASRLKGLRVSIQTSKTGKRFLTGQGASRAKALARVAFTRITRFVSLTGTPAPNGLQDLWGICFFSDAGKRLGTSFTAFSHRWFRAVPGSDVKQQNIEPLPYADEQIRAAIKDITIAIEARDHFDLPPLIENHIKVELPPAAMKIYKEMERSLFTEIQGVKIEAFNAAAMTQKCIATGTPVLSNRGWVPIEQIVDSDLLWDGKQWVGHGGLVSNGSRVVQECWGVQMTPDHKVLTTAGWVEAQEVNRGGKYRREEVRLPDSGGTSTKFGDFEVRGLASPVRLRGENHSHNPAAPQNTRQPVAVLRVQEAGDVRGRAPHTRVVESPSLSGLQSNAATLLRALRQGIPQIRGAGYRRVRRMAHILREFFARHGGNLQFRLGTRSSGQRRALLPGELPLGRPPDSVQQQKPPRSCRHPEWAHDRGASSPAFWTESRNHVPACPQRPDGGRIDQLGPAEAHVYDIVNCGPRHRFTVKGVNGEVFLAHNCLQIASGAVYTDDKGAWELIYDGKIEALESVVEESGGMPVLCFYHFKSDLARILKAFPKAVHLGDDPKIIERWNAGKIQMLVAHPQSAGHGLSLQHGSNIMCYFSSNWNLEADQQAAERLGPTRQAQSGYKRPVFLHRLVGAGTIEETVVKRLKTKASVQDALMEAMKARGDSL